MEPDCEMFFSTFDLFTKSCIGSSSANTVTNTVLPTSSRATSRSPSTLKDTSESTATSTTVVELWAERIPSSEVFENFFSEQFSSLADRKVELELQLKTLIYRAEVDCDFMKGTNYKALKKSQVEEISFLCQSLSMCDAVTFRALELYQRFAVNYREIVLAKMQEKEKAERDSIIEKLLIQKPIRMCAAILVASKLHCDRKFPMADTRKINDLLWRCGYFYFRAQPILSMERLVLKTLRYQTQWVTPYDLIEQIISLVCVNNTIDKKLYHYSILILEFFYLNHHEIYSKLWERKFQYWNMFKEEKRENYKYNFELNTPLRSTSIVYCAMVLLSQPRCTNKYLTMLSDITGIPRTGIDCISSLILELLIQ